MSEPEPPAATVERVGAHRLQLRDSEGQLAGWGELRRRERVWAWERGQVEPSRRRHGHGGRLVLAAHQWAREEGALRVHVRLPAESAETGFWQRHGYRTVHADSAGTELAVALPLPLPDPAATHQLGMVLAGQLRRGDLVLLSGPLGAGKTGVAQGIGAGLGVRGPVTSPTFVLARLHHGELPMLHVDVYRLRDSGGRVDLDDLDLDQSLQDSVTVVEWGEGLVEGMAESRLEVHLDRPATGPRTARVAAAGHRWSAFA